MAGIITDSTAPGPLLGATPAKAGAAVTCRGPFYNRWYIWVFTHIGFLDDSRRIIADRLGYPPIASAPEANAFKMEAAIEINFSGGTICRWNRHWLYLVVCLVSLVSSMYWEATASAGFVPMSVGPMI